MVHKTNFRPWVDVSNITLKEFEGVNIFHTHLFLAPRGEDLFTEYTFIL